LTGADMSTTQQEN